MACLAFHPLNAWDTAPMASVLQELCVQPGLLIATGVLECTVRQTLIAHHVFAREEHAARRVDVHQKKRLFRISVRASGAWLVRNANQ